MNSTKGLVGSTCSLGDQTWAHTLTAHTTEEVDRVVWDCLVCAKLKPKYYKPTSGTLVNATRPFKSFSVDFKGPLSRAKGTGNQYILTVVDVYSRFPWAYPTRDQSAESVIECLSDIFAIGGAPQNVHSDQGASFMSEKVQNFLEEYNVTSSRATPYSPRGMVNANI